MTDDRSGHQTPQARDHACDHDELDRAALKATAANRIAHDDERRGKHEQRNRGKARHGGPRFEQPEAREAFRANAIARSAQPGDCKAEGQREKRNDDLRRESPATRLRTYWTRPFVRSLTEDSAPGYEMLKERLMHDRRDLPRHARYSCNTRVDLRSEQHGRNGGARKFIRYGPAARPRRWLTSPFAVFAALAAAAASFVAYVLWPTWPSTPAALDAPALPITVAGVVFQVPPAGDPRDRAAPCWAAGARRPRLFMAVAQAAAAEGRSERSCRRQAHRR